MSTVDSSYKIIDTSMRKSIAIKEWSTDVRDVVLSQGLRHIILSGYFGWKSDDISFLRELPQIDRLDIIVRKISDISPLYEITSLQELSIEAATPPLDFSRLKSLRSVNLRWSPERFDSLLHQDRLQRLSITHVQEANFREWEGLRNLRALSIGFSRLRTMQGLEKLVLLEQLGLAQMPVLESLGGCEGCEKLRFVVIEKAKELRDISALEPLRELRTVGFSECPKLKTILPLKHHLSLQAINLLNTTSVEDGEIAFLKKLPALQHVSMRDRNHYNAKSSDFPKHFGTVYR